MASLTRIVGLLSLTSYVLTVPVSKELEASTDASVLTFSGSTYPSHVIEIHHETPNYPKVDQTLSHPSEYTTSQKISILDPRTIVIVPRAMDSMDDRRKFDSLDDRNDTTRNVTQDEKTSYSEYEREFSFTLNSGEAHGKVKKLANGESLFSIYNILLEQSNEKDGSSPDLQLTEEENYTMFSCGPTGKRSSDTHETSMYCPNGLDLRLPGSSNMIGPTSPSRPRKITVTNRVTNDDGRNKISLVINPYSSSQFRCHRNSESEIHRPAFATCDPNDGTIHITMHKLTQIRQNPESPGKRLKAREDVSALAVSDEQLLQTYANVSLPFGPAPHEHSNHVSDLRHRLKSRGISTYDVLADISPRNVYTMFRREKNPSPGVLPSAYLDNCYYCSRWDCWNSFTWCIFAPDPQMAVYEHQVQQYQKNQTAKAKALVAEANKKLADEAGKKHKSKDDKETTEAKKQLEEDEMEEKKTMNNVKAVESYVTHEAAYTPRICHDEIQKRSSDESDRLRNITEELAVQQNSTANVDLDNDQGTTVILRHIKITEEELEIKVKNNINASGKARNEAEKKRLMDERKRMMAERKQLKEERVRLMIQRANLKAEREKLRQLEADFAEAVRSHNIEASDRAVNEEKKRRLEAQKERLETQRERLEAEREKAVKMEEQQLKANEVRLQQKQEQERIREEQQRQRELEEMQREARERQKEDIIKQQEAEKGASFVIEVVHDEHRQGRPDAIKVKTLTVNFGLSSISRSSSESNFEFPSSMSNFIPSAATVSISSGASAPVTPGPSFAVASDGSISTVSAEASGSIRADAGVSGSAKANVFVIPSGYSLLFPGASSTASASVTLTPTPTYVTAPNGSVFTINAEATASANPIASTVTASDGSISTITAAPFAAGSDDSGSSLIGTATASRNPFVSTFTIAGVIITASAQASGSVGADASASINSNASASFAVGSGSTVSTITDTASPSGNGSPYATLSNFVSSNVDGVVTPLFTASPSINLGLNPSITVGVNLQNGGSRNSSQTAASIPASAANSAGASAIDSAGANTLITATVVASVPTSVLFRVSDATLTTAGASPSVSIDSSTLISTLSITINTPGSVSASPLVNIPASAFAATNASATLSAAVSVAFGTSSALSASASASVSASDSLSGSASATVTSQLPTATAIASSDSRPIPPVIIARPPRAKDLTRRVFKRPTPDLKCYHCSPAQCAVRATFCIFARNREAADALQAQRVVQKDYEKNEAAEKQQEDRKQEQQQNEGADDKEKFGSDEDQILAEMEKELEAGDKTFAAEWQKQDKENGGGKGGSSSLVIEKEFQASEHDLLIEEGNGRVFTA